MRIYTAIIFSCLSLLCIKGHAQTTDSTKEEIFTRVEIEASFPGGADAWRKFLEKNLNPNVPVDRGAPMGQFTVIAQFVVSTDGTVSDLKALTNNGYGMEQEVLRILRKSTQWQPATMNGRPVKAYRKQPVSFMVVDDAVDVSTYFISAGQDNKITIKVNGVKDENLKVTASRGTITSKGDGIYIINVSGTERVILTLHNSKKNDKDVGVISMEVR